MLSSLRCLSSRLGTYLHGISKRRAIWSKRSSYRRHHWLWNRLSFRLPIVNRTFERRAKGRRQELFSISFSAFRGRGFWRRRRSQWFRQRTKDGWWHCRVCRLQKVDGRYFLHTQWSYSWTEENGISCRRLLSNHWSVISRREDHRWSPSSLRLIIISKAL